MRSVMFAAVAAVVLAGPALAQGPIATTPAGGAAAPQPTRPSAALPPPGAGYGDEGPEIADGPCGPEKVKSDGTLEKKPHGEIEGDVGTGGYRRVAGMVCQPIGKDGAIAVGASQTQGDFGSYRRR